ncbi:MAG TPA: aminoglycoside phosphotransferase family protein [Candidatus Limnocylindria bacterium]|nr:aminoglycoside phosphotransferase family protein [Candidatus Limnocylindria bacterium]
MAGPGTAFEVALYRFLHRAAPERGLTPIATEVTRGWIVLPDGGLPLGECVSGTDLVDALVTVLPQYGQLQRDLAAQVDDLLALGIADMRAAIMPRRFDEALEVVAGYIERRGDAADWATYEQLAALSDTFAAWCDRLAQAPAPASLDHNDLHPWNILVPGVNRVSDARFYDWGDSVVAHPFASPSPSDPCLSRTLDG